MSCMLACLPRFSFLFHFSTSTCGEQQKISTRYSNEKDYSLRKVCSKYVSGFLHYQLDTWNSMLKSYSIPMWFAFYFISSVLFIVFLLLIFQFLVKRLGYGLHKYGNKTKRSTISNFILFSRLKIKGIRNICSLKHISTST